MNISEERLRELVVRVLRELEAEGKREEEPGNRKKLYMICVPPWNEGYQAFLEEMEAWDSYDIYPVIPASWQKQGYESRLRSSKACRGVVYRSCLKPGDLDRAVSLFPVVPRDMVVKTALCISDTFETSWIAACIQQGWRTVFLRSGLERFSGREKPAYVSRILDYYRQVLEYGIEIRGVEELSEGEMTEPADYTGKLIKPDPAPGHSSVSDRGKKRVITAANVEQFASEGIVYLKPDDIVTDLARDRAGFLDIIFK